MIKKYFSKKHLSRGLEGLIAYIVVMLMDHYFLKRYSFDLATIILGGCLVFVVFWGGPFVRFKANPEDEKERRMTKIMVYILFAAMIFLLIYFILLFFNVL